MCLKKRALPLTVAWRASEGSAALELSHSIGKTAQSIQQSHLSNLAKRSSVAGAREGGVSQRPWPQPCKPQVSLWEKLGAWGLNPAAHKAWQFRRV